nr:hypothetical protein [uncultured Limnohabitans sp.]
MRCKDFVFLQSSGQINEMGQVKKTMALSHVWMCGACRTFRHNDELLSRYLMQFKANLLEDQGNQ